LIKRYHIYVTLAFLIPTLISFYAALLCGPIWLRIIVFILTWVFSFAVLLMLCWKLIIWWNRRKREKSHTNSL